MPERSEGGPFGSGTVLGIVLDRTQDAVLVLDEAARVRLANPGAERLFSCSPGGLSDRELPGLLPRDRRGGPQVFESAIEDDAGVRHHVEVSASPVEIEGVPLAVAVLRDLTGRREAERDRQQVFSLLERAKQDWERTFDSIGEGILLVAGEGVIFRVNRALVTRLGKEFTDVLGRSLEEVLGPEIAEAVGRARARRGALDSPVAAPSLGALFEVSAYPVRAPGGRGDRSVVILKDVTERERLRQQLLHAEKLSALGEIISGIAHELNNPLTGVLGFAQMLAERDSEGRFEREIAHLREESLRATRIVKNLLAFARRQEPSRAPERLNDIVRNAVALREYDLRVRDVEVELSLDADLPPSLMDGGQIQQVVLNLLNNAAHAVRARRGSGRVRISTGREGDLLRIAVEDEGPGVPPGIREAIFTPFFTTKPKGRGTGLGLPICAGIVRDHGGEIRLDPAFRDGARFVVEIPFLAAVEAAEAEEPAEETAPAGGGLLVLLVDDEEAIREVWAEFLSGAGHEVETAAGGEQALRRLRARDFDVVVTDHLMPGMSGVELHRLASEEMPRYRRRFVLVSGDPGPETRPAETGARFLAKPLDREELVRVVREVGR